MVSPLAWKKNQQNNLKTVSRKVTCYNLDAIISVGYRVNSVLGVKFRKWATEILKDYLLRGYAINARMNQIEERIDRRLIHQAIWWTYDTGDEDFS